MALDNFSWLENWYLNEHKRNNEKDNHITIATIDNPGWSIDIDLFNAELQQKQIKNLNKQVSEDNWILCRVVKNQFKGDCGPKNFLEMLNFFRSWVDFDNFVDMEKNMTSQN